MQFLSEYGLFLLKTFTLVIAFLITLIGIVAISRKPKPKIEIKSLNEQFDSIQQRMAEEIKAEKKDKKKIKKQAHLRKKNPTIFVCDFKGDIKASQVEQLRETVTAILAVATEKDEVVLRLESPGGTVNGYGLAAAQLQRFRDCHIPLTVCIDKVAASGGYLMACVASKIIAAPFAIIGSIGVLAQLPNFHRWLKKNDIDIELITAGEYKRTLTILGENTEKGRKKFKEEIELIHLAFRDYVLQNRQQLDIDKISTGEHWLAKDAFALRLVDSLKTSDAYLMEKFSEFNCYHICVPAKHSLTEKLLKPVSQLLLPFA